MRKKTFIACILLAVISCNKKETDTKKEGEKLMQLSREWSDAATSLNVKKTLTSRAQKKALLRIGRPLTIACHMKILNSMFCAEFHSLLSN